MSRDLGHEDVQITLSAAADGEADDELEVRAAHRHADHCPQCAAFRATLGLTSAAEPPVERVVFQQPPPLMLRTLWVLAVLNVALGIPLLLEIDVFRLGAADASHLTRDGTLAILLGVVAGIVAYQPRWGRPLVAVVVALLSIQILAAGDDLHDGHVQLTFELLHIGSAFTAGLVVAAALVTKPKPASSA